MPGPSLRIALVYPHLNLSGSLPRQQVELARYLVEAGHQVHVYLDRADSDPALVPRARFHGVATTRVSQSRLRLPLYVATFAWNASKILRRERGNYDVVHGRGASTWEQDIVHVTGIVDGEIARARNAREEGTALGQRLKDILLPVAAPVVPVRRAIERRIFEGRRPPLQIHTDSGLVRDDLLAAFELDPERVQAIPPGVSLDEFRPPLDRRQARQEAGISGSEAVILFCGHSWERKGLDRAIASLARMHHRAQLLVVGAGNVDRYEGLAQQFGVLPKVHFVGSRSDAWRYFQAADIFVLPTRVDLWGMTIAEAMASGVTPVTTVGAAAAEVIENGVTGFVLPEPFDPDAMASTCDRLVADHQLRRRIGQAAAEAARGLTWEAHGRRVEAAMLEVREHRLTISTADK